MSALPCRCYAGHLQSVSGADPGICIRGPCPTPSPSPISSPLPLKSRVPLKPAGSLAERENEFGALYSCEKATGGNRFEYSEMHV